MAEACAIRGGQQELPMPNHGVVDLFCLVLQHQQCFYSATTVPLGDDWTKL